MKLERQVLRVLTYLVQHRDRVVPRQELLEQLWPQRYVSDWALARCIALARQVLGDSGRQQRVIATLHGEGYRFILPAQERAEAEAGEQPEPALASHSHSLPKPIRPPLPTNSTLAGNGSR